MLRHERVTVNLTSGLKFWFEFHTKSQVSSRKAENNAGYFVNHVGHKRGHMPLWRQRYPHSPARH